MHIDRKMAFLLLFCPLATYVPLVHDTVPKPMLARSAAPACVALQPEPMPEGAAAALDAEHDSVARSYLQKVLQSARRRSSTARWAASENEVGLSSPEVFWMVAVNLLAGLVMAEVMAEMMGQAALWDAR